MKKKILIILIVIGIIGLGVFLYIQYREKKEREFIKDIKSHYQKYVITTKLSDIYNKNHKKVGTIGKGIDLELASKKIDNVEDTSFKIKNTNFYIDYQNVKKSDKKEHSKEYERYLIFNKDIKSNKKIVFYEKGVEVLSLNETLQLPIRYMDNDYYYVVYLDRLLQVKKDSKVTLVDSNNTDEKEADYVSIIHYDKIDSSQACNGDTCIDVGKVKEHINYLNQNKFYAITLDELNNWLDGKIRLKQKSILLLTNTKTASLDEVNTNPNLKIELLPEKLNLVLKSENKKVTKASKKDYITEYKIKVNTSLDSFKKMTNGEEVKEPVVVAKNTTNEQKIPVLNYHFFYDPSKGEGCNENICLDVKNFAEQLDYLKNNGYKALTMDEFRKWMYREIELPQKSVLITVDDGAFGTGKHNGNKLIPMLEARQMHATLFLISGWWDVNNYRSPYLDIQSHTYDMHNYGDCGDGQVVCATKDQLIADLKKSLAIVDNNNSFCFPFYSYSNLAIEGVKEAGFKMAFIGGSRKASRSDDKYKIPRYPIYKTTTMSQFINMVN